MSRIRILLCGHPNPLGCPNHSDVAREILMCLRDQWRTDQEYVFVVAPHDTEPIPYEVTPRGRQYLIDHGMISDWTAQDSDWPF